MLLEIGLSCFLFPIEVLFCVSPHPSSTDHAISLSMISLWFFEQCSLFYLNFIIFCVETLGYPE